MEKKNKAIIFIIIAVIFLALIIWLATKTPKEVDAPENNVNNEVENGEVLEPGIEGEEVAPEAVEVDIPADFDWRESVSEENFEVEFMSDEEKELIGIAKESRVQVLARDEASGTILAYKVIENDADIVTDPTE
ncbi:MAG: hypothetical protein PHF49_03795 [Patescibacteria group bacterium]|nr:hypothetical protein [Patescibacteria group bacterium]